MKRLAVLVGCAIVLLGLAGCQSANRGVAPAPRRGGVEVIIEGDGEFPRELAGRWRENSKGWQIVFEPDGTISSAVHTIGRVIVRPEQTTTMPMGRGSQGVFEAGRWLVKYAPESRELLVRIVLEHYKCELGIQKLEGSSVDLLVGEVSEDARQWRAEWFAYPEYIVTTDIYDHYKLPVDPNENPRHLLVFEKVVAPE